LKKISELGIALERGLALDYGCGVGRLSRALASRFERVDGVDMSELMLKEARDVNRSYTNLSFLRNNGHDLNLVDTGTVNFIYSHIALQHSPNGDQQSVISEFWPKAGLPLFKSPPTSIRRLKKAYCI
jgi:ubiquinone/menaquinone biosynthesis C-methylase UbiE